MKRPKLSNTSVSLLGGVLSVNANRKNFKATADSLICEQTFIHKLKTHSKGVDQDLSFLSPNSYFHQRCRPLTST